MHLRSEQRFAPGHLIRQHFTARQRMAKISNTNLCGNSGDLDGRIGHRVINAIAAVGTDHTFRSDHRALDLIAAFHHGVDRDQTSVWKQNVLEPFSQPVDVSSLAQFDEVEVRLQQSEIRGRQRRKDAIYGRGGIKHLSYVSLYPRLPVPAQLTPSGERPH